MEKTAKVKSVKFEKEFVSAYGTLYNFQVEFENGDKGQYASKKNPQTHFVEGQESAYDFIDTGNGYPKIKTVQTTNNFQQSGGFNKKPYDPAADNFRQALIVAQSTMKLVTDLCLHGKIEFKDFQSKADGLMQIQFDLAKKYQNEVNKPLEP